MLACVEQEKLVHLFSHLKKNILHIIKSLNKFSVLNSKFKLVLIKSVISEVKT